MFEQHLSEQETPKNEAEEVSLFRNYEIKAWDLTPRIYKILAGSVILNILAIVIIGQTNLLTMKGCESPWVGRVCQVLDTVYVGALIFGTDRDYIDVAYERTALGDADIIWVDRTGDTGPFTYPEGYFQLANPEQFIENNDPNSQMNFIAPGIPAVSPTPAPPANDLMARQPRLPRANRNPVRGRTPTSPFSIEGEDEDEDKDLAQANTNRPGNTNTDQQTANANTGQTPATGGTGGIDINRRPMIDLANHVNDLRDANQVDLRSEFSLSARGRLTKDGRLDPRSFRFISATGTDPSMIDVVKESVEAFNDAGFLQYIDLLTGRDLALEIQQDAENITAVVESEVESETRARSVKTILDMGINEARKRKSRPDASQNDKDELVLLENASVEVVGRKVIIRFLGPKAIVHPMIERKLAEQAAEARKPNGNAIMRRDGRDASE
ncbi:MAG TPA: hypothetical protein PKD24_16870 [Pyrinomonadaceae bacterium]|nr:hypothetical protein [Pyrinomonadaceae bacterium]HMP66694.1 hypothetical protein [Pyrinomonadaceae bacterium]